MKNIFPIIFLFFFNNCYAQNEYVHWVVPDQPDYEINFICDSASLNGVDINSDTIVVVGGATISDKQNGQVLFFTDGEQVWNRNFEQMPNGYGLNGGWESAQPALIVPQPGSDHIFYVFTVDIVYPGSNGLEYSIVDMNKNGGLGDVTIKNVFLDSSSQMLNGIYNPNTNSFWVIACNYATDNFMTFRVDSNGLDDTPILSPSHVKIILNYQVSGYIKSSPDGKNVACTFESPAIVGLYNFNKNSGVLNLQSFLPVQKNDGEVFGTSFSPDNSKLYISAGDTLGVNNNSEIYQYDVTSNDTNIIQSSRITIDSIFAARRFVGMQMGPDGKIYIVREGTDSLDIIESPDSMGKSCHFILDKIPIPLPYNDNLGLSNNIDGLYYFATPDSNINLSYTVGSNNTVSFTINTERAYNYFAVNFGDDSDTTLDSTQFTFTHQYNSLGTYTVKLYAYVGCIEDSVTITIILTSVKFPTAAPSFIIPTIIYGNGGQTKWQIINMPQGSNTVTLYDELGRVIYKSLNYPNDFDMRPLPSAMYFYRLTLESGQEYSGKIVLVR